jgi:hypothetical protein
MRREEEKKRRSEEAKKRRSEEAKKRRREEEVRVPVRIGEWGARGGMGGRAGVF